MTVKIIRSRRSGRPRPPSGRGRSDIRLFQKTVLKHYRKNGRDLPWRLPTLKLRHGKKDFDPYHILVSEIMLQQTQVLRVLPKYAEFTKRFPTVQKLAAAPLASVLRAWQGLGYNRRAKYLHEAAKAIMVSHNGKIPREYKKLRALPGIGDYTAKAVRVFAWNEPELLLETNIRSVYLHHFFSRRFGVEDTELVEVLKKVLPEGNTREWHWALMDYGTHLKKTIGNASRRSAHHAKQKPFKGSDREIRGALLKVLAKKSASAADLFTIPFEQARIETQLKNLQKEGFITVQKGRYRLG